jgi:hypothetical protein
MILPSYDTWAGNAQAAFLETHEEEACWNCYGSGENECCECGHDRECEECDGTGSLYRNLRTGEEVKMFCASPQEYYRAMMKELSRLAKWQGKAPVTVMLPYARSIRKQNPVSVRLRKYRRVAA